MRKATSYERLSQRRIYTTSYRASIISVAHLHSETINVWSHLFGTLWFCTSATRFAATAANLFSPSAAAILAYLTANVFSFACSTLYHVFADHAEADAWLRLDHMGIVYAIWASGISFVALSLVFHPSEQCGYAVLGTAGAALCALRLSDKSQHGSSGRSTRISTHVAFGSFAALPEIRCWHLHTLGQDVGLLADFGMLIVINGVGGAIYATHLLDKSVGVKIGMPNASHHVMHVLAVAGEMVYEQGLMLAYRDMLSEGPTLCA